MSQRPSTSSCVNLIERLKSLRKDAAGLRNVLAVQDVGHVADVVARLLDIAECVKDDSEMSRHEVTAQHRYAVYAPVVTLIFRRVTVRHYRQTPSKKCFSSWTATLSIRSSSHVGSCTSLFAAAKQAHLHYENFPKLGSANGCCKLLTAVQPRPQRYRVYTDVRFDFIYKISHARTRQ